MPALFFQYSPLRYVKKGEIDNMATLIKFPFPAVAVAYSWHPYFFFSYSLINQGLSCFLLRLLFLKMMHIVKNKQQRYYGKGGDDIQCPVIAECLGKI